MPHLYFLLLLLELLSAAQFDTHEQKLPLRPGAPQTQRTASTPPQKKKSTRGWSLASPRRPENSINTAASSSHPQCDWIKEQTASRGESRPLPLSFGDLAKGEDYSTVKGADLSSMVLGIESEAVDNIFGEQTTKCTPSVATEPQIEEPFELIESPTVLRLNPTTDVVRFRGTQSDLPLYCLPEISCVGAYASVSPAILKDAAPFVRKPVDTRIDYEQASASYNLQSSYNPGLSYRSPSSECGYSSQYLTHSALSSPFVQSDSSQVAFPRTDTRTYHCKSGGSTSAGGDACPPFSQISSPVSIAPSDIGMDVPPIADLPPSSLPRETHHHRLSAFNHQSLNNPLMNKPCAVSNPNYLTPQKFLPSTSFPTLDDPIVRTSRPSRPSREPVFAVKQIRMKSRQDLLQFYNEVRILRMIAKIPGVIKYAGSFSNFIGSYAEASETCGWIVTNWVGNRHNETDLRRVIDRDVVRSLDPRSRVKLTIRFCRQLLLTLKGIHERSIIHGDIKPANILVEYPQEESDSYGMSRFGAENSSTNILFESGDATNQPYSPLIFAPCSDTDTDMEDVLTNSALASPNEMTITDEEMLAHEPKDATSAFSIYSLESNESLALNLRTTEIKARMNAKPDIVGAKFVLADFGNSQIISSIQEKGSKRVCTCMYLSPEMAKNRPSYTTKHDIFSLGVVALELLTGQHVFTAKNLHTHDHDMSSGEAQSSPVETLEMENVRQQIANLPSPPPIPRDLPDSDEIISLLEFMLQPDPSNRPSAEELLKHPCFTQKTPDHPHTFTHDLLESIGDRLSSPRAPYHLTEQTSGEEFFLSATSEDQGFSSSYFLRLSRSSKTFPLSASQHDTKGSLNGGSFKR